MVETLREELEELINELGTSHLKTVEKSQELDRALNKEMGLC